MPGGGALLLHNAETKDDCTPTDSFVAVENMRARLSLVTLTPFAVPRTTCTRTSARRNTRRGIDAIRGWMLTRYSELTQVFYG